MKYHSAKGAKPEGFLAQQSEKLELPVPGFVVQDGAAVQRPRNRFFVGNDGVEVGLRLELGFDRANEAKVRSSGAFHTSDCS